MSNKKDKKGDDSCCRTGRKVFEGRLLSFQEDIINDHPINGRGRKRSSMRNQGKSLAKLCIALRWRDKRGLLSIERERRDRDLCVRVRCHFRVGKATELPAKFKGDYMIGPNVPLMKCLISLIQFASTP